MRRKDLIAVAVIWALVLAGSFLLGVTVWSDDPGGAGETGAVVGFALTLLYLRIRRWLW